MEEMILNLVCLFVSVFALGVAVWALFSGMLEGVDALFLMAVCLVMAALFGWTPAQRLRQSRLREPLRRKERTAAADDGARPAAARATQPQERET